MANILVVDDSKFFSSLLKKNIEQRLGFHVTSVETYAEAVAIIDERGDGSGFPKIYPAVFFIFHSWRSDSIRTSPGSI